MRLKVIVLLTVLFLLALPVRQSRASVLSFTTDAAKTTGHAVKAGTEKSTQAVGSAAAATGLKTGDAGEATGHAVKTATVKTAQAVGTAGEATGHAVMSGIARTGHAVKKAMIG